MEVEHLIDVHPVDVVGAEDRDDVGAEVVDEVQVLQDRVRRAAIPRGAEAHLRRHHGDEGVGENAGGPPGQPQMLDQRL